MNLQEIIVDSFAGGGGASLGIEMAMGRGPVRMCGNSVCPPIVAAIVRANMLAVSEAVA